MVRMELSEPVDPTFDWTPFDTTAAAAGGNEAAERAAEAASVAVAAAVAVSAMPCPVYVLAEVQIQLRALAEAHTRALTPGTGPLVQLRAAVDRLVRRYAACTTTTNPQ